MKERATLQDKRGWLSLCDLVSYLNVKYLKGDKDRYTRTAPDFPPLKWGPPITLMSEDIAFEASSLMRRRVPGPLLGQTLSLTSTLHISFSRTLIHFKITGLISALPPFWAVSSPVELTRTVSASFTVISLVPRIESGS